MRDIASGIKNWIYRHQLHKEFARFLIIGGISTIIFYSTFIISLRIFGIYYLLANFIGFICGISFGYPMNKHWTFKKSHQKQTHFPQYLAVYLTSLGISTIFLKVTVDYLGIIPEIASILSIMITTCTNFSGIRFLVFKK
jgi:putative flippase GtrA